jgi:hypothetical protein
VLHAFDSVPDEFQSWIYDAEGQYRPQVGRVLFTAEVVRKAGRGYREFRRQLGNYSNGYNSVMHQEINSWITALLAETGDTGNREEARELRNECTKVCKFLWQLTKQQTCNSDHTVASETAASTA